MGEAIEQGGRHFDLEADLLAKRLDGLHARRGRDVRLARSGRDSDMAPGFWRAKRRSTTPFIRWPAG